MIKIVGAIIVLAAIGFFIIKNGKPASVPTSKSPSPTASSTGVPCPNDTVFVCKKASDCKKPEQSLTCTDENQVCCFVAPTLTPKSSK